jgi:hypothetical protein
MAPLPSLIAKNGHGAELRPGEIMPLEFTKDADAVTEKVDA